jgi:hypothetical protein
MHEAATPLLPAMPAVSAADPAHALYTYSPKPDPSAHSGASVEEMESLLAAWFERPVLLLGSGRAGIIVYSTLAGLDRHRDACLVPPFLPTCVTDTLSRYAFPVLTAERRALTLLNHQYGFPQTAAPDGPVLEDICHAFFASPSSGAREWRSEAAIFSLPKFFGLRGMAGGLVLASDALRARARAALNEMPRTDEASARFIRDAVMHAKAERSPTAAAYLEAAYALLNHFPDADGAALAGSPRNTADLREIGARRRQIIETYLAHGTRSMPASFTAGLPVWTPFAFPYFGAGDADDENRIIRALAEAGVAAATYRVDVARNALAPDYCRCILIPCHHTIPDTTVAAVSAVLAR